MAPTKYKYNTKRGKTMKFFRTAAALSIIMAGTLLAAEAPRAQTVAKAGTHATTRGSAEYFTGSVRVERLLTADGEINAGVSYVTFEPGARTN